MIQYANKTHIWLGKGYKIVFWKKNIMNLDQILLIYNAKVAQKFWEKFGNSDYSALSAISAKPAL